MIFFISLFSNFDKKKLARGNESTSRPEPIDQRFGKPRTEQGDLNYYV